MLVVPPKVSNVCPIADARNLLTVDGGPPAIRIQPYAPNNSPREDFAVTIGETKPWDPGIALDHVDDQRNAVGNLQSSFFAAHFRPHPAWGD